MNFNAKTICGVMMIASIFSCSDKPEQGNKGPSIDYMKKFSEDDQKKIKTIMDDECITKSIKNKNKDNEAKKFAKFIFNLSEKLKTQDGYKELSSEIKKNFLHNVLETMHKILQKNDEHGTKQLIENLHQEVTIRNNYIMLGDNGVCGPNDLFLTLKLLFHQGM